MRVSDLSIRDGQITKKYFLTDEQRACTVLYFEEYAQWIRTCSFSVPRTKLVSKNGTLEMRQQYIQGRSPSMCEWKSLTKALLSLPEDMPYGLDANSMNFIFEGEKIYFIDFYPLLVKNDLNFLLSQFSYSEDIIMARFFNKWGVITCFLNRLKKMDSCMFLACLELVSPSLLPRISHIPGRDARRLAGAIYLNMKEFVDYYEKTKSIEEPLSSLELRDLTQYLENVNRKIMSQSNFKHNSS